MSSYYHLRLGQYNWASSDKQWSLQLTTPFGCASETFDKDDKPEVDGLRPTEVLDLIEKRLDSYWMATSREKDKARIAEIRAHATEIDLAWIDSQINTHERAIQRLKATREDVLSEAEEAAA